MLHIFLKGIIIGLLTGMPLGPIGALCLRTTLTNGAFFGFAAGLGSCVADSIYAIIAALGISFIARFLAMYQHYFRLIGGIILLIVGAHIILSKKENTKEVADGKTLAKSFITTFILALANPATIFSFLFVFASYGSKNIGHGVAARTVLIAGVFSGSFLWWIILILAAERFHKHLNPKKVSVINKTIGVIIVFSGMIFIAGAGNYKNYIRPSYMHSKLFKTILRLKPRYLHKL